MIRSYRTDPLYHLEDCDVAANAFGDKLRELRRKAKLNLVDLADHVGHSVVYLSDIERGQRSPPPSGVIGQLMARVGRSDLTEAMITLAIKIRKSIEISLKGRSEDVQGALAALARSCNENELDDETAREIKRLLEKSQPEGSDE
jgi:transcriptional regulator with XRE-family HTH domain